MAPTPAAWPASMFNPHCRNCPRLAGHLDEVKADYPDYHCRPVPPVGDSEASVLIVGLAPGMHGANASGRPFTGDHAGILLYRTLFEAGFSNQPESTHAGDSLRLHDCRITNAVKCLPPGNKPTAAEVRACNTYLANELGQTRPRIVLALGRVAHEAVLRALGHRQSAFPFRHGQVHACPDGPLLVDSYHCSRYNTQTRRLTPAMFREVFVTLERLRDQSAVPGTG